MPAHPLTAAVPLVVALLLAGCTSATPSQPPGASSSTPAPAPTGSVPAPSGTDLSGAGTPSDESTERPDASPAPTPDEVEVVVTFAGWNAPTTAAEVGAYVPRVETGGRCTLVLTSAGGTRAEVESVAEPDATSTSCGLLSVPGERLAAGTWTGTVTYTSPTASGEAPVPPMEIP